MSKSCVELHDSVGESPIFEDNEFKKSLLTFDDSTSDNFAWDVVDSLKLRMAKMDKFSVKSDVNRNDDINIDKTKPTVETQSSLPATPEKLHKMKAEDQSPEVAVISDDKSNNTLASHCQEKANHDGDDGMMSEIEQARQFIADSKTINAIHKTPIKKDNFNKKRSDDSSPITPGKCKRAKLITLSSPKTKKATKEDGHPFLTDTKLSNYRLQ